MTFCSDISYLLISLFFPSLEGDNNQPMSEVWDWNMYGTELKFHGWFINTANEDGDGGEDDASFASEDSDDEVLTEVSILRAVQVLAIRANFRISRINAHDWYQSAVIYSALEGEVQEVYTSYRMLYLLHALCLFTCIIYCNKLKSFTFMLSCVGRNGFGTHWTI